MKIEEQWSSEVLSDAVRSIWGKSDRQNTERWMPLWRHLADSSEIAGKIWDEWLPESVKNTISTHLPGGNDDGKAMSQWLTAIHDIGKATPAFAIQVPHLSNRIKDTGLTFRPQVKSDRSMAPHATAGMIIATRYLQNHNWNVLNAEQLTIVVGGHHGMPPSNTDLRAAADHPYLLGWSHSDAGWKDAQNSLLDWVATNLSIATHLETWRELTLPQPTQSLLTAIVIAADWIASDEEHFAYDDHNAAGIRAMRAWDQLGLFRPWKAQPPTDIATLYQHRFTFPAGAQPRPVQEIVAETAHTMIAPGLLVIEAPMGEGKTEAALAAAEILAERTGAGGVYIGLPTRATSDAMFTRVLDWMKRLPSADGAEEPLSVRLAHGKAQFNDTFRELINPRNTGIDEYGVAAAVHRWTSGRKKVLLSSFVIGTIDQLLFAALKTKHVVLRHLGLAGKVVIVDEAHAYDVYMSAFLDRALEWLASCGVSVIVLSATLPAGRRVDMMRAFDNGLHGAPPRRRRRTAVVGSYGHLEGDIGYPVISATGPQRKPQSRVSAPSGRANAVLLNRLADDNHTIGICLRRELADGGCALVIRNTVRRVQDTARELRALIPDIPVSVAHSRFIVPDRYAQDTWLRDTFGPPDRLRDVGTTRPLQHIVVSSQVAEQSLDIDFDVLITDLAPVDLVLQRIGRLHRHDRDRPIKKARCFLTGVDWGSEIPQLDRGSRTVYGEYLLLRSLAALNDHISHEIPLEMPTDIAPLVQAAYSDDDIGPDSWRDVVTTAKETFERRQADKTKRAQVFRLAEPKLDF